VPHPQVSDGAEVDVAFTIGYINLKGGLMILMNQPFNGQLGNLLLELLDSPNYHTLNIVVAFAKSSGVLRIKDSLRHLLKLR
jgi:hypothetical protein